MEPEDTFPHSQVPATCPYHEPARPSPYSNFLKIHLNIILPSTPGSPKWPLPSGFPTKTLYTPPLSPICATSPAHLILEFITRTILGEEYRSLSASLRISQRKELHELSNSSAKTRTNTQFAALTRVWTSQADTLNSFYARSLCKHEKLVLASPCCSTILPARENSTPTGRTGMKFHAHTWMTTLVANSCHCFEGYHHYLAH